MQIQETTMSKDDIHNEIDNCKENIQNFIDGRDWNMVRAWEERLEDWINKLLGLGE
jgi:predicted AlkP superfamily phosphohydrolase/phosphomutase